MKKHVVLITLAIVLLSGVTYVFATQESSRDVNNPLYIDQLNIRTINPQPAGKNTSG